MIFQQLFHFLKVFWRWLLSNVHHSFAMNAIRDDKLVPTSVNYHFTRQCNYKCGFCFHTAISSFVLPIKEAKRGLSLLRQAGMEKINFSGGEPFIHQKGRYLGELVRYCKQELKVPSVSIVSNGSLIIEDWFSEYGRDLDILAISCDSFNRETNRLIGRGSSRTSTPGCVEIKSTSDPHLIQLNRVREWCGLYGVAFKINTVVNAFNVDEEMGQHIAALKPVRWKVFQCLLIGGENQGEDALRNAEKFVVSDEQFQKFLDRHSWISILVPESNIKMRDSYLILDERMRFLDCTGNRKKPSASLLDVGVEEAIRFSGFDQDMFIQRGGKYVWSKDDMSLDW